MQRLVIDPLLKVSKQLIGFVNDWHPRNPETIAEFHGFKPVNEIGFEEAYERTEVFLISIFDSLPYLFQHLAFTACSQPLQLILEGTQPGFSFLFGLFRIEVRKVLLIMEVSLQVFLVSAPA